MATTGVMGCAALLRVSGCPMRLWTAGGNPELFQVLRRLDELAQRHGALSARLADRVGRELVPHECLSRDERAWALGIRRQLHRGGSISERCQQRLIDLSLRLLQPSDGLTDEIEAARLCARDLAALELQVAERVAREQERLLREPWDLLRSPSASRWLSQAMNPSARNDIEARLRRGEPWDSKRLRQKSAYLWRLITRAATDSTPRGWFAHVALVPIEESPCSITVGAVFATEWTQNVHVQRHASWRGALERGDPALQLSIAPLHRMGDTEMESWVVDPEDPCLMVEVTVRRTDVLKAICAALHAGPTTLDALEAAVLGSPEQRARESLRKLLDHLAGLGILQGSMPPVRRLEPFQPSSADGQASPRAEPGIPDPGDDDDEGYLDVYRRANGALPRTTCLRIQRLVQQALRVLSLIAADAPAAGGEPQRWIDERPRQALAILGDLVEATRSSRSSWQQSRGWPPPRDGSSTYSRLVAWMKAHLDDAPILDLDPMVLDALGAPEETIDWPLDGFLRVSRRGEGFLAVLDDAVPAGVIDARFVTALRSLHGEVPQATAYRQFLEHLETTMGITFVEVLVPPLSDRAANAVRRPIYTRAWTGDPDIQTYCPADHEPPRYIPLEAITLRATDQIVAEVDGHRIWPLYHATRSPLPPWNILLRLLCAAAPRPLRWSPRLLGGSLALFPERSFMPRITVGGDLVIAAGQWRIEVARLCEPGSSDLQAARQIEQLRRRLDLPRWVVVQGSQGGRAMPCDLESLRTIQMLRRLRDCGAASLVVMEMLPAPDELLIEDATEGADNHLASELLLRLPCDESPAAMALRVARRLGDRPLAIDGQAYHLHP